MKRFLKSALAFCLLLCVTFSLAACGNDGKKGTTTTTDSTTTTTEPADETFSCSGKTFVYDSWGSNNDSLTEGQRLTFEGLMIDNYGPTQFIFDENGTFVWKNPETDYVTLQGKWRVEENSLILTNAEDETDILETLVISGNKFYVIQPLDTYNLYIYFKVAV